MKQRDATTIPFFIGYAMRKVQETNMGLNINYIHQVVVYGDDLNIIGNDIKTINMKLNILLND